ncbi:hypothetical protein DSO57_1035064 [Entomophthora muscae]|uniref:Uncharacterized protein n=1 Tax=Entomophthora muscae TaxID=34485 RepID=A0ACC2RQK7_9FUNG|nr:hypothetical protein DSO57_1035064 [Entomophthora muscae]
MSSFGPPVHLHPIQILRKKKTLDFVLQKLQFKFPQPLKPLSPCDLSFQSVVYFLEAIYGGCGTDFPLAMGCIPRNSGLALLGCTTLCTRSWPAPESPSRPGSHHSKHLSQASLEGLDPKNLPSFQEPGSEKSLHKPYR